MLYSSIIDSGSVSGAFGQSPFGGADILNNFRRIDRCFCKRQLADRKYESGMALTGAGFAGTLRLI
jgi:hypothetical protein